MDGPSTGWSEAALDDTWRVSWYRDSALLPSVVVPPGMAWEVWARGRRSPRCGMRGCLQDD